MSLHPDTKDQERTQHESNKVIREHLSWAHHKLHYTPVVKEEFQLLDGAVKVLEAICLDLQAKIEKVEPPVIEESVKKEPMVVDAAPLHVVEN